MRLYGMYYTCKKYINSVKEIKVLSRNVNGNTIRYIEGWERDSLVLNELASIVPIRNYVGIFYETVPVFFRDRDKFDLDASSVNAFIKARDNLITAMDTVINTYEAINPIKGDGEKEGFDILLPSFKDIGEFSKCLEDLDFVMKQCPYLCKADGQIKYGTIDIGTTWLTFGIFGTSATAILYNLSKLVDAAVKIKSHVTTVKMQEEALKSIKLKNEIAAEVISAFKETNKVIMSSSVNELSRELGELHDGEEEAKVERSLEKLAYWMDKGLQIYSTIDAPDEVKDLFPKQQTVNFLSDNLLKLIEEKKE